MTARYALERLVFGSGTLIDIDEANYRRIAAAVAGLREIVSAEEKFDALMENYVEVEEFLLKLALHHLAFRFEDYVRFVTPRSALNRKVVNLLSTTKLYLDSLPQHAQKLLPHDEIGRRAIIEYPSTCFDRSLAYRAMSALRDYAQHHAFPVHLLTRRAAREQGHAGNGSDGFSFSAIPAVSVLRLKESSRFRKATITQLEAVASKDGDVPLMPLIREYVELLGDVHKQFREHTRSATDAWEAEIAAALDRYQSTHPDEILAGLAAVRLGEYEQAEDPIHIVKDAADYRAYLRSKNRLHANLSRCFVKW